MHFYNVHIHSWLPPWNLSFVSLLVSLKMSCPFKINIAINNPLSSSSAARIHMAVGPPNGDMGSLPSTKSTQESQSPSIHYQELLCQGWGLGGPSSSHDGISTGLVLDSKWSNHNCFKLMFCFFLQFGIESEPIPEDIEDPKAYRYGTFDNYWSDLGFYQTDPLQKLTETSVFPSYWILIVSYAISLAEMTIVLHFFCFKYWECQEEKRIW